MHSADFVKSESKYKLKKINNFKKIFMPNLPVVDVDVDADACVDVDDGVALVADTAMAVPRLNRHDLKIDYLIHDGDDQLGQLYFDFCFVFVFNFELNG